MLIITFYVTYRGLERKLERVWRPAQEPSDPRCARTLRGLRASIRPIGCAVTRATHCTCELANGAEADGSRDSRVLLFAALVLHKCIEIHAR